MYRNKLPLFIFVFSIDYFSSYKLLVEGIIRGEPAYQPNYKYQAVIMSQANDYDEGSLACSAAFISEQFLLAPARCVMENSNLLKKFRFFAILGVTDLKTRIGLPAKIKRFHTYFYHASTAMNDIVIPELTKKIDLEVHGDYVKPISIPKDTESFQGRDGVVTGYGYNNLDETHKHTLKYASTTVKKVSQCTTEFQFANDENHICGRMEHENSGLCEGDLGNPLMVDMKLVGIAIVIPSSCDDFVDGTIYIKVSNYYNFIFGVLRRMKMRSVQVIANN